MKPTYLLYFAMILAVSCKTGKGLAQVLPANKSATAETVNLYNSLFRLAATGFMVGHQDDLAYGVGWKATPGRSDVKAVTGDYPAVYGWELGGLERDNNNLNLDSVPFDKMVDYIKEGYARGGIITLSWHADSPIGAAGGAWDTTHGTVAAILPGGERHSTYTKWLDRIAAFIHLLKGKNGEGIPVLFRPFHEHTGTWFWWCRNASTAAEYKSLWTFTRRYLQDKKGLHNLLWVYNTSGDFSTKEEYLERYPGDDEVDLLSFDTYQHGDPATDRSFETNTNRKLTLIGDLATARNKPFALAETGYEAIPYPKWWTGTLMNAIGGNKISYVLLWRNHGYHNAMKRMHYYVPYDGQASADDFVEFHRLPVTLFESDIRKANVYK